MINDYHTRELMEILGNIVRVGLQFDILNSFERDHLLEVPSQMLKRVLQDKGMLSESDANKVL